MDNYDKLLGRVRAGVHIYPREMMTIAYFVFFFCYKITKLNQVQGANLT